MDSLASTSALAPFAFSLAMIACAYRQCQWSQ